MFKELYQYRELLKSSVQKEIRGKYGERIADRFREMFEVIAFEFDSYRGKSERRNV